MKAAATNSRDRALVVGASLLTLLTLVAWAAQAGRGGLTLTVVEMDGSSLASYPRAGLDTGRIDALLVREERPVLAEWTGVWDVPPPGFADLVLKSDGAAFVEIDGVRLEGTDPAALSHRPEQALSPGPHQIRVFYERGSDPHHEIFLKGVTAGGRSVPVSRRDTFAAVPSAFDRALARLPAFLAAATVFVWMTLLMSTVLRRGVRALMPRAPLVLLCLVTVLGGALRFEALVYRYWLSTAPGWAESLASDIRALRPGVFDHTPTKTPYEGDPFSYLNLARSMGGFYEPSAREPVFPFLTRVALVLANDRDIGINFVSALASTLVVAAIYALGARLLSPWAGLLAGLLWAMEWQVISFSVEGWRDDLFTLEVAACAAALVSLYLRPTRRGALFLGIVGGFTLLTRLSALTFLIPGVAAVVLLPGVAPRRERLGAVALAVVGMGLLAGPFMIACALAFGDPFHAVNVHAAFYRGRGGLPGSGGSTAIEFLAQSQLPWSFLETGYQGLTSFPFLNKWQGFSDWLPGLGDAARFLALAGLPVLLWRSSGLIALVVLFSSIAPYAWTWEIPGGGEWRFTLPAYAFYLVSAAMAVEALVRLPSRTATEARQRLLRYALTGAAILLFFPWLHRQLDWFRVSEAGVHQRPALIEASAQAEVFFTSGWRRAGNTFVMAGGEALIRLPIKAAVEARVVLRPGAARASAAPVEVFVGAERIASLAGERGMGETLTFDISSRHERTQRGLEIRFVQTGGPAAAPSFALLWVRVEPRITFEGTQAKERDETE